MDGLILVGGGTVLAECSHFIDAVVLSKAYEGKESKGF